MRPATLVVLLLALAACARQGASPTPAHVSGPLTLSVDLQPTSVAGRYSVVITVLDQHGATVDGATVSMQARYSYFGLKPMRVHAAPKGNGRYSATVRLPSGSGWLIKADAIKNALRGHLEAQEDLN